MGAVPQAADRARVPDLGGQAAIGRPRIGYYGVIDERIDLALITWVAEARPDWNLVMVGPRAKISTEDLPRAANIHWLGMKSYEDLPRYLAGWDVAMMRFALNDSTRHLSPTKTPEYLCGGCPVISTPISDVVQPYGNEGLVHIAAGAEEFVRGIAAVLRADRADLIRRADRFLASQSWDTTWAQTARPVERLRPRPRVPTPARAPTPPAVVAGARAARARLVHPGRCGCSAGERARL